MGKKKHEENRRNESENTFVFLCAFILLQVAKRENLQRITEKCNLENLITKEDIDKDNRLGTNEFYAAFSKLYSKYRLFFFLLVFYC